MSVRLPHPLDYLGYGPMLENVIFEVKFGRLFQFWTPKSGYRYWTGMYVCSIKKVLSSKYVDPLIENGFIRSEEIKGEESRKRKMVFTEKGRELLRELENRIRSEYAKTG